jgi:hypothetical protein
MTQGVESCWFWHFSDIPARPADVRFEVKRKTSTRGKGEIETMPPNFGGLR